MTNERQLCVLPDTNIWRSELVLTSPLGEALIFAIVQRHAVIGLPEVVERELVKHVVKAGKEAISNIERGLDTLRRIVPGNVGDEELYLRLGLGLGPGFLDDSEYESRMLRGWVESQIENLEGLLVRVPFQFDDAVSALDRIMEELPPNGPKNQQFKDSVIWLNTLELAQRYELVLVTSDTGFYEGRDRAKGMAKLLSEECASRGAPISIAPDVRTCLEFLGIGAPGVDEDSIASRIVDLLREVLHAAAERRSRTLADGLIAKVSRFATGDPSRLALEVRLSSGLLTMDEAGVAHEAGQLSASGEAFIDIERNTISGLRFHDVRLVCKEPSGEESLYGDAQALTEAAAIDELVVPYRGMTGG